MNAIVKKQDNDTSLIDFTSKTRRTQRFLNNAKNFAKKAFARFAPLRFAFPSLNRRQQYLFGALFIFLLFSISPAFAQESAPPLSLSVAERDNPLIIRGKLNGDTNSFSGNVRLTVAGGDVDALRLLASDLQLEGQPERQIDRSYVTIPDGTSLSEGQPRDVRVTVNAPNRPGIYTGVLTFLLPDQTEDEALEIPIELHVTAVPTVVPIAPNLSWQVVRCDFWLDCKLATWFLPESVLQDQWEVWLDNQTAQAVEIVDGVTILRGTNSGHTAQADDVELSVPHTLPANQVEPITVAIHRQQLAPDSYQGTLRFKVEDVDDPISVTTGIDVRQGPFWALIVVLLGIVLGRLVRDMETPVAKAQLKLMPDYRRLRAAAYDLQNEEARLDALSQLDAFMQRLNGQKETEEALATGLEAVSVRIDFYAKLEEVSKRLSEGARRRLAPLFDDAIQAVKDGRQSKAEQLYAQIKQEVEKVTADGSLRGGDERAEQLLKDALAKLGESATLLATDIQVGATSFWLKLLARLSGIRLTADIRFWIVRPILSLVLLLLLVLWGMQALYVNAGATFGAAGVYDYMGLLLWGLTADVVSRSLSNLPAKLGQPE